VKRKNKMELQWIHGHICELTKLVGFSSQMPWKSQPFLTPFLTGYFSFLQATYEPSQCCVYSSLENVHLQLPMRSLGPYSSNYFYWSVIHLLQCDLSTSTQHHALLQHVLFFCNDSPSLDFPT
jgi:hypothetical protein